MFPNRAVWKDRLNEWIGPTPLAVTPRSGVPDYGHGFRGPPNKCRPVLRLHLHSITNKDVT